MKFSLKRKISLIITIILTLGTLAFIWGSSMLPKTQSAEQSGGVFSVFKVVFDAIFGEGVITPEIFRKLAHGTEFLLLGVELNLLLYIIGKYNYKTICLPIITGFLVGIIDECIQILSDRGPMVTDALIDFGGVVVASLIFFIVWIIVKKVKNKTA